MIETDLEKLAQEIAVERSNGTLAREIGPTKRARPLHRTLESYAWLQQERRLARVTPATIREAMVSIGAPEYARGVIEAMRERGSPCPLCHASAMNEWAFKSFERVAKWANAGEDVLEAMAKFLGVASAELAKRAVNAYQNAAQGEALDEQCRARLEERGWTVLPPSASVNGEAK